MTLGFDIHAQPDATTCGPTCLHAVYRHFGDPISLDQVIDEADALDAGGTLGALLGVHALRRGYAATLYSFNLEVLDPTWFGLSRASLRERLTRQLTVKAGHPRIEAASRAFLEFLDLGGELRRADLSPDLIRRLLDTGFPVLTGLSATWLYDESREVAETCTPDDIAGEPAGHFVVLTDYDESAADVAIADPLQPNALAVAGRYRVSESRLITAILLGVLTYDGNLLQLRPGSKDDTDE